MATTSKEKDDSTLPDSVKTVLDLIRGSTEVQPDERCVELLVRMEDGKLTADEAIEIIKREL